MKKLIFLFILICSLAFTTQAQVQFKISLTDENQTYVVSMIPQVSWQTPLNLTSTAQVTIKAPQGTLEPINIENLQANTSWESNSRINAPDEAPEFDYISFALTSLGTAGLTFEKGTEIALFSFQNANPCPGKVYLLNNETDPFMPPNSRKANIGNQMTTLGAQGEAYSGIVGTGVVDCLVSTSETFLDKTEFTLHPNPAVSFVQLEFNWEMPAENVNIALRSADGKIVLEKEVTFFKGSNSIKIDLNDLQPGLFFPDLTGEKWKAGLNGFTIIK